MTKKIYLAGLPRGGTTLVSMILGQHHLLEQMGESMYAGVINPINFKCSCGAMPCSVCMKIYEAAKNQSEIVTLYEAYGIIDKIREPYKIPHELTVQSTNNNLSQIEPLKLIKSACDGLDSLVKIFRKILGDYIFVDNTKEIIFAEELLKRDDWQIILITRDPRGMALSTKESGLRKNVPRPVSSKIPVYLEFAEKALKLKQNPNVFFLKYENLCKDADSIIRSLCDFLEIGFEENMLHFKQNRGHTLIGNRMRLNSEEIIKEDLRWKNGLTDYELRLIVRNTNLIELYSELGYSLV